jgi:acyl-CoA thioesterase-1
MKHLAVLFLWILSAAPPALAAPPDCRVPEELIAEDAALPALAAALKAKRPVTIIAIGGAGTAGTAAADPAHDAYPRRLEDTLRRRHPGVPITVVNKGVPRQTAQEMVDRFATDVYPLSPTLVIWETGTVDAVRDTDVEAFGDALQAGLDALHEHKFDIILVNMQYSRSTATVINFEPYLEAMEQRADVEDIYLFRRFEMMRYWSENGVFDFSDVPRDRRAALASQVYACLAERLADAIDQATR